MFVFLFAGHEVNYFPPSYGVVVKSSLQTTARTLCFTFALLALHPGEQERLYQHIKRVMSSLNKMPVGSRNLNLYRWLTSPVDLRGHEPLHSIISVSPPDFYNEVSQRFVAFSTRLLGCYKCMFRLCYYIRLTARPQPSGTFSRPSVFRPEVNDTFIK
jgi:hypothetical protein